MSYNPNQPYNSQPRRGAAGDGAGPPYKSNTQYQQQNFAVPKAGFNQPANQQAYGAPESRQPSASQQQYAPSRSNPNSNPANQANEWEAFFAQAGSTTTGSAQGNRGTHDLSGQNYAGQQGLPGQQGQQYSHAQNNRQGAQFAPQQTAPAANYRPGSGANAGYAQNEYDPSSLSSLKQTLAQTISSNNVGGGGAYQNDYNAYNPVASAPKQGYYNSSAAPDNYSARPVASQAQHARAQQPYVPEHAAAGGNYNSYSTSAPARATQGPSGLVPGDVRYQSAHTQQQGPSAVPVQQNRGGGYSQNSAGYAAAGGPAGHTGAAAGVNATGGAFYNRRPDTLSVQTPGGENQMAAQHHKRDFSALYDPAPAAAASHSLQYSPQYNAPAVQGRYTATEAHYQPVSQQRPQLQHAQHQAPQQHQHPQARYQQSNVASFSSPESPVHHASSVPHQQAYSASYNPAPAAGRAADRNSYNPVSDHANQAYPTQAAPYSTLGAPQNARYEYDARGPAGLLPAAVQHPRLSKWSAGLMDPLDIHDMLLHNTVPAPVLSEVMLSDGRARETESRYTGRTVTAAASSGGKRARRSPSRSPPRQRGATTANGDGRERAAPLARKSESTQRSRSRSRSGSVSTPDRRGGERTAERTAFNPYVAGGAGNGAVTSGRISKPLLDLGSVPISQLMKHFQLPAFSVNGTSQLNAIDLSSRFPQLYLPNDFLSVHLDAAALQQALNDDVLSNLINSVPHVLESNPAALVATEHPSRVSAVSSDILDPPKFTYSRTEAPECSSSKAQLLSTAKPVKFQVKVLVCLGMNHADTDRIDHRLPQKLRFLCGRRKGSIMLLGCPWSAELDCVSNGDGDEQDIADATGANNPLHNRSLLVRTAQRALYAQCLLRMPIDNAVDASGRLVHRSDGLVRLSEVHYHRPQEVIRGKVYPEQEEITTLFLYTVQPHMLAALSAEDLERNYRLFCRRQQGTDAGPRVNESLEQHDVRFVHTVNRPDVLVSTTVAADIATPIASNPGNGTTASKDPEEVLGETAAGSDTTNAAAESSDDARPDGTVDVDVAAAQGSAGDTSDVAREGITAVSALPPKASTSNAVTVKPVLERPENPTLLLSPMPLPEEVMNDASRKGEGVSLRVLPMSSILDYTQEDRSERLFETSLAAELARSLLSVNFANLVTDFVIAEHPVLHTLGDMRVLQACRKLRAMIAADKAKVTGISTNKPSTVSKRVDGASVDSGMAEAKVVGDGAAEAAEQDDENMQVEYTVDHFPNRADADVLQASAQIDSNDPVTQDRHATGQQAEVVAENATAPDSTAAAETLDSALVHTDSVVEGAMGTDAALQESPEVEVDMMGEQEARLWRRRFVSAARWFDVSEDFLLQYEHLKMILNSSTRNLTRADVDDALDRVCRHDILRYETFI